jgi:hypothetical protein
MLLAFLLVTLRIHGVAMAETLADLRSGFAAAESLAALLKEATPKAVGS